MLQFPPTFEKAGNQAAISGAKCHLPAETAGWLGREGSNLRMLESKSSALPLGDAPSGGLPIKPARPVRKPVKHPRRQDFLPPFLAVAGAGGHGYKGASRGEGPSFRG